MHDAAAGLPWFLLVAGAAAIAGAVALARDPARFVALCRPFGGPPVGPGEMRFARVALGGAGGGWCFIFAAEAYPWFNQVKPFWIALLLPVVYPLAGLLFLAWFAWVLVVRRLVT